MNQIEYIIGNNEILSEMTSVVAWKPFDAKAMKFCGDLSKAILAEKGCQRFPDLVTLAFWLRNSNVQKIRENYDDLDARLGRGAAFHIAPGNVALSFAYSLVTGILTGNTNIVRLPSREFEQASIFCEALNKVLVDNQEIAKRICLIKYPHDKSITDTLSKMCHSRIVWGGDETVETIRKSPIMPRAVEITFANRYSVCIIDSDKYLDEFDSKRVAHSFYLDTYLSDQNACSSPRIIFWRGNRINEAKELFWDALYKEINSYEIAPVTVVNKLLTFCKYAAENECRLTTENDFRIMRIDVENPNVEMLENIGNSGFFYECDIDSIEEILPLCKWELQTITYVGIDAKNLQETIMKYAPFGVDRIVPVGNALDFSLIWDGRDIIRDLTRIVSVK